MSGDNPFLELAKNQTPAEPLQLRAVSSPWLAQKALEALEADARSGDEVDMRRWAEALSTTWAVSRLLSSDAMRKVADASALRFASQPVGIAVALTAEDADALSVCWTPEKWGIALGVDFRTQSWLKVALTRASTAEKLVVPLEHLVSLPSDIIRMMPRTRGDKNSVAAITNESWFNLVLRSEAPKSVKEEFYRKYHSVMSGSDVVSELLELLQAQQRAAVSLGCSSWLECFGATVVETRSTVNAAWSVVSSPVVVGELLDPSNSVSDDIDALGWQCAEIEKRIGPFWTHLNQYFPSKSVGTLADNVARIFDTVIEPDFSVQPGVGSGWNKNIRVFRCVQQSTAKHLGFLYMELHSNSSKSVLRRPHAARIAPGHVFVSLHIPPKAGGMVHDRAVRFGGEVARAISWLLRPNRAAEGEATELMVAAAQLHLRRSAALQKAGRHEVKNAPMPAEYSRVAMASYVPLGLAADVQRAAVFCAAYDCDAQNMDSQQLSDHLRQAAARCSLGKLHPDAPVVDRELITDFVHCGRAARRIRALCRAVALHRTRDALGAQDDESGAVILSSSFAHDDPASCLHKRGFNSVVNATHAELSGLVHL
mmetsp:Transcript_12865/g.28973  ORF Transcript_12865/g.28973 Transcript_12865/m.28973 type:complete len:597 (+) Transcript_12865:974-2764(+)